MPEQTEEFQINNPVKQHLHLCPYCLSQYVV